jgi:hypothetical protein
MEGKENDEDDEEGKKDEDVGIGAVGRRRKTWKSIPIPMEMPKRGMKRMKPEGKRCSS